jgi:hypothetical protein
VQMPEAEAPRGQAGIDGVNPERQVSPRRHLRALRGEARPQGRKT